MEYRTHKSYVTSKIWIVLLLFIFIISYIITYALYVKSDKNIDIDIKLLTVSYISVIVLCLLSLTLFHFQKLRLGAFFAILLGLNLITNVAFTNIIASSTETLIELFEPIFLILPTLNANVGKEQFEFLCNIINIVQVLFGIFIIITNLRILFKHDKKYI